MTHVSGTPTDRSFDDVNGGFGGAIARQIEIRDNQPFIQVCDVGCGPSGRAIQELAARYSSVLVTGIDTQVMPRVDPDRRVVLRRESIFDITPGDLLPADIVYSYGLFPNISMPQSGFGQNETMVNPKVIRFIRSIISLIACQGMAIIGQCPYTRTRIAFDRFLREIDATDPTLLKSFLFVAVNDFAFDRESHLGIWPKDPTKNYVSPLRSFPDYPVRAVDMDAV